MMTMQSQGAAVAATASGYVSGEGETTGIKLYLYFCVWAVESTNL